MMTSLSAISVDKVISHAVDTLVLARAYRRDQ